MARNLNAEKKGFKDNALGMLFVSMLRERERKMRGIIFERLLCSKLCFVNFFEKTLSEKSF